jgi:uncharacterized protein YijF (DUF1287 family)
MSDIASGIEVLVKMSLLLAATLLADILQADDFSQAIMNAAIERTRHQVRYDGAYYPIDYPNGDVPKDVGVCTDVIIRSYRVLGVDLQRRVHEDMVAHFDAYPSRRIWGLEATDRNIDHRRVPNLKVFFQRQGVSLAVTQSIADYLAGDLVTWRLPGGLPHIGMVTNRRSVVTGNPLIVHNIGSGPRLEDRLFDYEITGHYRYVPVDQQAAE